LKFVAAAWLISPIAMQHCNSAGSQLPDRTSISSPERDAVFGPPSAVFYSRPEATPLQADTGGKITLDYDNTPTVNGNGAGFGFAKQSICDRDRWLASNLIFSGLKMLRKIAMNQLGNLHGRKSGCV
jgi:hypothetical protein